MKNYSQLNKLISSLAKELNLSDNKKIFFIVLNCFLISKIRTKKDNGDNILKKVYPYIFDGDSTDYDSKVCMDIIDLFSNGNCDDDIIGYLYEKSLTVKERKDYGQFYTRSNKVVNYMVDKCSLNDNMKILEPSSGSGVFLLEIVKRKLETATNNNISIILKDIFKNIYANDLDPLACKITEVNILTLSIDYIKKALSINPNLKLPQLNISNIDFCHYDKENYFDLVISNPPYVTLYGKRSRNMNEEKRKYYNTFDFVQNKKGNNKFNMVMFFLEKGLKALKENGKLVFIIDISFFETAFIDMRKYILENCYIESITTNMNEFEDVASGQLIISLVKTHKTSSTTWFDFKEKTSKNIDQSLWYNANNDYKIYIPLSDFEKSIDEKVKKHKLLDFYYPNKSLRTCCALTGRTDDFLIDKNKKTDNYIFPFLEGSKGIKGKFAKPTTDKYIEYNYDLQIEISNQFKEELEKLGVKNKKRVTLGDKEAYLSPKIFIRQSANDIIATYTEEPFSANNSIYIMTNKKEDEVSKKLLKYTCGILNSDLITFYSRINNIIRRGNGKTPQIKTSDLKRIHIAYDKTESDNLIQIVDKMLEKYDDNLYNELNTLVYKIYDINENEINYINNYLKKDD